MAKHNDVTSVLPLIIGGAYILAQLYLGAAREARTPQPSAGPSVAVEYPPSRDDGPYTLDREGRTPLHLAARLGLLDLMEVYLLRGDMVDATDRDGNTPLLLAAAKGHEKAVLMLLSKGAQIDARNRGRRTPFLAALFGGHGKVAIILANAGADLKAVDGAGWTALHCAAESGLEEWVKRLLILRFDPNALRVQEWTPLHVAIYKQHPGCVRYLLEAGANPALVMGYGHSALDMARNSPNPRIREEIGRIREMPRGKPAWMTPPAEQETLPPEAPERPR
ncbi:MAG TPA: ankyrin repeat domain-containing protein [Candidatus Ozemobacteraceae bacterium]|nr:ankyrin repeat domain-containing protein [Candidatus Ozemobacteraceae bacterium]